MQIFRAIHVLSLLVTNCNYFAREYDLNADPAQNFHLARFPAADHPQATIKLVSAKVAFSSYCALSETRFVERSQISFYSLLSSIPIPDLKSLC